MPASGVTKYGRVCAVCVCGWDIELLRGAQQAQQDCPIKISSSDTVN